MNDEVNHSGHIDRLIDATTVSVAIDKASCGGCSLGRWCSVSHTDAATVVVTVPDATAYKVNEAVTVTVGQRLLNHAIWWCLAVPCAVLVATVAFVAAWASATVGCLAGLVVLGIYYGLFYIVTKSKKDIFQFKIKK